MRLVDAKSPEWTELLGAMPVATPYHDRWYHQLSAELVDGRALLFSYERGPFHAVLPLLLPDSSEQLDATSAYGYPGPLANTKNLPPEFVAGFQRRLRDALLQENVVTASTRINPFSEIAKPLLGGMGAFRHVGGIISVDLTPSDEERLRSYRRNHRKDLAKIRKLSVETVVDETFEHLKTFTELYRQSMVRVDAEERYFFDEDYFGIIAQQMTGRALLLISKIEDEIVCAGLFFHDRDVAYAHLVGYTTSKSCRSPTKLLFDDACRYFRKRGCKQLLLGGGLGARQDSLFHFKSGFSDIVLPFFVWEWNADANATMHASELHKN